MKVAFETKEDRILSPYTGWIRERWVELAEKMIVAIQPYLTAGKGGLAIPNPVRWVSLPEPQESYFWMEGYSRTRALIASWMVGTGKTTLKIDGRQIDILEQFIEGLLSVSDPSHPEYIGDRYHGYCQWLPEVSAIGLAIYLTKELVWPKLSSKEQQQVVNWLLYLATSEKKYPDNNWHTFIANIHFVLKALGQDYDEKEVKRCMDRLRDFYLGDGWFNDGGRERGFCIEQYNAWGFHYFLPAFVLMGTDDSTLKEWILDSLKKFVVSYQRFFGADGSFPMWGRSWIYRPAVTVPFIWAEILGVSPLSHGESRRLVSGQMSFWCNNDYFYENMIPTMGYVGENLELIDPYSQYGSVYWGAGAFFCLLMSPSHEFWTATEEALPVEQESYCVAEKTIGMLVAGNHETGEVQVINHRAGRPLENQWTKFAKKYGNFAYSTRFGIDLKRTESGYNCDNMFSISPDGKKFSQRIVPHLISVDDNYGASYHYPLSGFPFSEKDDPSVKITTQTYLKDFCQVRVHTVETERELLVVREGGFALNYFGDVPEAIADKKSIGFWDGGRGSFIKSLWGFSAPESIEKILESTDNFNTLGGFSVTPTIVGGKLQPGKHIFISLSGTWFGHKKGIEKLLHLVKEVDVGDDRATVNFSDGSKYSFDI